MRFAYKLFIVGLVVLGAYMFYLDATIRQQFSGNKWQVPAQIYARPLSLSNGQEITHKEVLDELDLLGYRKVAKPDSSGEYSYLGNTIEFVRRSFQFPEGEQPQRHIRLTWKGARIHQISDLTRKRDVSSVQLEPWLVTRLLSSNAEDRMLVNLDDVPETLVQALITTEDRKFFEHHGVNPLAIARALVANISAGRTVQGGSTLTQQLVKNLYLSRERSIIRKIREALMALIIDARYSKEEILQAYLNEVFLGQNGAVGVHGFGLASHFYFDRPLNELDDAEMATLVGMIKGPSFYNPRRYPERTLERRNLVLRLLFEDNYLSADAYQRAIQQPLRIASGASLASGKHPAFMDKVKRELSLVLADPDIRQSGVKVFTTLDINAQRRAERAVRDRVARLATDRNIDELEAALLVSDIKSGEIRAIVGSVNTDYAGFNRALDASRSIGSLVKPAVYLSALEQAATYTLASPLKDEPIRMKSSHGNMWEPQNADKTFRGQVPLVTALTKSLNVPTVSLGMELGLDTVVDTLHRLGVEQNIDAYPALTLGALNLSLLQVNQLYQTIANNGFYQPLHAVLAVMSPENDLLWQYRRQGEQRIDEKATYLLNYALHKVTLEGTASQLKQRFGNINMAGKTGTTDDYRDSWFAGFDRNILITSWLGKDDNSPTGLTGTSGAMQVFMAYQSLQEPKSLSRRFPDGLGIAHFDIDTGRPVTAGCQNSMSVPAILDALPVNIYNCDGSIKPPKEKSFWEKLFGG
nr:penicillin-binding protein 1B [Aestuariibacter salexigens]